MHKIKKYANRKLYDTTDKRYISLDQLSELIKTGEEVVIVDNRSGEDITSAIISQLLARDKKEDETEVPSSILIQLLRKGSGTVVDYAKRYAGFFQNAMTMAEDEIDKLVARLVKDKELSEKEGWRLKKEITGYTENLKNWIGERIDQRLKDVLRATHLATSDQLLDLTKKIEALAEKLERMEKTKGKEPHDPYK